MSANNLPSVTKVLSLYQDFSMVREDILLAAQYRGTVVHRACFALARGLWAPVPPEYAGYVESFKKWLEIIKEIHFIEPEIIDENYGFVGHPDIMVTIKGDSQVSIWDLKTPAIESPTWKGQLAAYMHLVVEVLRLPIGRCGSLVLNKDGKLPKAKEYQDSPRDLNAFLGALTAYRYFKGGSK